MQLLNSTHQNQSKLANYCRTGNLEKIDGLNYENVSHYRRLVYNIVDDMLQNAYPLTFDLLSEIEWNKIIDEFFSNHSCISPQVWYMPKEFKEYLIEENHSLLKKYLFLKDLLEFEWLELEMFMMEDKKTDFSKSGDILFSKLIINPEHEIIHFQYPVHKLNAKEISKNDKDDYYIIAHRNKEGEVIFTETSAAFISMLHHLSEESLSINELLQLFEDEFHISLDTSTKENIIQFFQKAYQQDLIIGFKN